MAVEVSSRKRNLKNKRKNSEDEGTNSSSSRLEKREKQLPSKNGQLKTKLIEHNNISNSSTFNCVTFLGLSFFLMLSVGLLLMELHVKQKGMTELLQLYLHGQSINHPVNVEKAKLKMESDVKVLQMSPVGYDEDFSTISGTNEKEHLSHIKIDIINIEESITKTSKKEIKKPIKNDLPTDSLNVVKSVDSKKNIVSNKEGHFIDELNELEKQIIPDDNLDSFKKKDQDIKGKNGDKKEKSKNQKDYRKQDFKISTKDLPETNLDKMKVRSHSKLLDLYTEVEKLTEDVLAQDPENDMVLKLAPHLEGVIRDINSNKISGIEESLLHIKEILLDLKERLKEAQGLESNKLKETDDEHSLHNNVNNKIPVDEVIPDPVYIAPRGSPPSDESSEQGVYKDKNTNLPAEFIDSEVSNNIIGKDTIDKVIPAPVYDAPRGSPPSDESSEQGVYKDNNTNLPSEFIDSEVSNNIIGKDAIDKVIPAPVYDAPKENFRTEVSSANVQANISGKEFKLEPSNDIDKPIPSNFEENKEDSFTINITPSKYKVSDNVGEDLSRLNSKLKETEYVKFSDLKPVSDKSENKVDDFKDDINIATDKTEKLNLNNLNAKNEDSEIEVNSPNSVFPKMAETQKLELKIDESIIDTNHIGIGLSDNVEKKILRPNSANEELKSKVKENSFKARADENIIVLKEDENKITNKKDEDLNINSYQKLEHTEEKVDDAQETENKFKVDKTAAPVTEAVHVKSVTLELFQQHIVSDKEPKPLKTSTDNKVVKENRPSAPEGEENEDYNDQSIPIEVNRKGMKENLPFEDQLVYAEAPLTKDPAQALNLFTSSLLKNPKEVRSLIGKAKAFAKLAENEQSNTLLEKSIMAYLDVINLIEGDVKIADKELLRNVVETCIEKLYFRGWRQKVAPLLLKVMKHFPNDIKLWNHLGRAHLMTNDNSEALKVFQKVLQSWPDSGFAQVHYGFILKITNKNLTEAIKYLHKGILSEEEGTVDGRFYLHLGDAYQRIGKHKEAYKLYDDAAAKGLFLSKYQRSLHNIDRLKAKPVWTLEETTYSHFFRKLESNWEKIMAEGLSVMDLDPPHGFKPESELLRKNGEWSQFDLFVRGVKNKAHCAEVPYTCSLIENFSPAAKNKRGQVKFSLLFPGTIVFNHTGPTNCRLRSHLGLITPPGAALKVVNTTLIWEAGKIFVFDDSFEHEVWHKGNSLRLILIVDVWHPQITEEEKLSLSPI